METIVKSIPGINGSLYIVSGSNRYLLAECKVELQIVEESEKIPILGPRNVIKRRYAAIAVTYEHHSVNASELDRADSLGVSGDFLRSDGRYERLEFPRIELASDWDLTEDGTCEFNILCSDETLRRIRRVYG